MAKTNAELQKAYRQRSERERLDIRIEGGAKRALVADLGMSRQGSNITSLKNQARKLFNATISASYQEGSNTQDIGYRLADKTVLWWHAKDPEQAGLWKSTVTLSEHFFNEIIDRPVPIDMRAIKTLKQSPLALDIYATLTYRMSYLKKPTLIPWSALAFQLGSDYSRLRDFKEAFLAELKKVVLVYPQVHVEPTERGLMLRPSLTHISKKAD
jgi:hypothetical protein